MKKIYCFTGIYAQDFFPRLEETDGHTYKVLFNRVYSLGTGILETKFLKLNIPAKKLLTDEIQFDEGSSNILDGAIMLGIEADISISAHSMNAVVDSKLIIIAITLADSTYAIVLNTICCI